jgi:hypothetical protein
LKEFRASAQLARHLVIVLPGLGEDLADLERSRIAAVIQRGMSEADVTLVLASVRYYLDGCMPKRLHEQVPRDGIKASAYCSIKN